VERRSTEPAPHSAPREPVEAWRIKIAGATPPVFLLRAASRAGTHAGNELVLTDATVSRLHAELSPTLDGVRVRDLASRNGTFVNGVRVFDALALSGMRITLGQTVLTVEALVKEPPPAGPARFGALLGNTPRMSALFDAASRVAQTDTRVLIEAETGCGKELLARSLHDHSPRAGGPWVVFDCGAIAPSLVESTLFGHERGAFTGADAAREGVFEAADGGTLFLDELGELPLELQPRLLRCLESGEVRRLGSTTSRKVDVRVVAATHRDLLGAVSRGTFREDLYYRLAVVRLRIPPLRERLADLELLVQAVLESTLGDAVQARRVLASITEAQWQALKAHPWRGNVRELRNVVERSVALDAQEGINLASEPGLGPAPKKSADLEQPYTEQRDALLERFDREYLAGVLARHDGNFTRAAAAAGLDRMYFKRLLRRYGLGT